MKGSFLPQSYHHIICNLPLTPDNEWNELDGSKVSKDASLRPREGIECREGGNEGPSNCNDSDAFANEWIDK